MANNNQTNASNYDFEGKIGEQTIYLVYIGCLIIVVGYIQVSLWSISGERQTRTIREHLFRSILRKEIVFFDTHKTGELNTKLTDDINKIQNGIGDKIGSAAQFIASFITGITIGR
jgi:ATP-binding cassette, subfamily B (MDR/TAP), member 1